MNNLISINSKELVVKEFKEKRVVTFKDIDTIHERPEGTANKRFLDNQKHFIKNTDYFELIGDDLKAVKQLPNFGIGSNASKSILITESGYLMLVKSLTDDLAWKVQRELVNNYFRAKQLDISKLSPELQMFKQIFDTVAQTQLKQQEIETSITETNTRIDNIKEVIALDSTAWRADTMNLLNKIAISLGGTSQFFRQLRIESYDLLDSRMKANLQRRLTNKRQRMADEGISKSKREALTKIDVIADDKRLVEGYVAIVKEMAIKYGIADKKVS